MKKFIFWIIKTYILDKLNKSLKKDKYSFIEKYSPIITDINNTLNLFLESIKDREVTEDEIIKILNQIEKNIEKLLK